MSFEINWDKICQDPKISLSIKNFINSHLLSIELPDYVNNLQVTKFSLSTISPEITLKQIDDPLEEFYKYTGAERNNNDIQFLVELDYKGDIFIEIYAELVLNYPSPNFMALPVKLSISNIGIHSLCLIAYLSKQLFISFLCDISDPTLDDHGSSLDSASYFMSKRSMERIYIIRSMQIRTEIGQQDPSDGTILRSVGKLEQFLLEMFRNLLRKETAWPSWINFDFNDDHIDEDNCNSNNDALCNSEGI